MDLRRTEGAAVGLFLGLLCPASLFVAFWWGAACLGLAGIIALPERLVAGAAFFGLGLGLVLDLLFQRRWVRGFYAARMLLVVAAYLFWSVAAMGLLMGLPVGAMFVGILFGVYMSRRQYHASPSASGVTVTARGVALLTALVVGLMSLPIGLLALRESDVVGFVGEHLGTRAATLQGSTGVLLVGCLCLLLMGTQYCCSLVAVRLAARRSSSTS